MFLLTCFCRTTIRRSRRRIMIRRKRTHDISQREAAGRRYCWRPGEHLLIMLDDRCHIAPLHEKTPPVWEAFLK